MFISKHTSTISWLPSLTAWCSMVPPNRASRLKTALMSAPCSTSRFAVLKSGALRSPGGSPSDMDSGVFWRKSGLFTNSFFCFFQDKEGLFESFSLTSDSTSLPQIQRTQSGVDSIRLVLGSFHLLKIELGKTE